MFVNYLYYLSKIYFNITLFFFLMIRRPPRSTLFPTRRSSDLPHTECPLTYCSGPGPPSPWAQTLMVARSEEHTSELQSRRDLVCRLLLEKKKKKIKTHLPQKQKKKQKQK